MRISTAMTYDSMINSTMNISSKLQELSEQLSSGKKLNKSSDNPTDYYAASMLTEQMNIQDQNSKLWSTVDSRNRNAENTIQSSMNVMSELRTFIVSANNDYSWKDMVSTNITYVEGLRNQLLSLANSKNENNDYMFSGYQNTQPFINSGTGITYVGDQGIRQVSIDNNLINLEPSGDSVYIFKSTNVVTVAEESNWYGNNNIGNASISTNTNQKLSTDYKVVFAVDRTVTPISTRMDILDTTGTSIVNGTIRITGTSQITQLPLNITGNTADISAYLGQPSNTTVLNINGTPEDGDSFALKNNTRKNIFDTIDSILSAMKNTTSTSTTQTHNNLQNNTITVPSNVGHQQWQATLATALTNIDDWQTSASTVVSELGSNQNRATSGSDMATTIKNLYAARRSSLEDLDYASALMQQSLLTTQQQALYKTFSSTQNMSLFNYIA